MCKCQKKRLSPSQEREYLSYLRTLQAEGISVDIPDEWLLHPPPLDIIIAPPNSTVFDWPNSGAGYAIWVRLLSHKRCALEDCGLAVPWDDDIVIQSPDESEPRCVFGNVVFPTKEVLN